MENIMLKSKVVNVQKDKFLYPHINIPYIYKWVRIYHIIDFDPHDHQDIYRPLLQNDACVCIYLGYYEVVIDHGSYNETHSSVTVEENIPFAILFSNII